MNRRDFLRWTPGILAALGGAVLCGIPALGSLRRWLTRKPPHPKLDCVIKADASPALRALDRMHRDIEKACNISARLREATPPKELSLFAIDDVVMTRRHWA